MIFLMSLANNQLLWEWLLIDWQVNVEIPAQATDFHTLWAEIVVMRYHYDYSPIVFITIITIIIIIIIPRLLPY